jgi:hypothetical protein
MEMTSTLLSNLPSCMPTYIVFRRSDSGGYTPYTFDTPQLLGKWVLDQTSVNLSEVKKVGTAAEAQEEEGVEGQAPEIDFKKFVPPLFNSPFLLEPIKYIQMNSINLSNTEIQVILDLLIEHSAVMIPHIFNPTAIMPILSSKATHANKGFQKACLESRHILQCRLENAWFSAEDRAALPIVCNKLYKLLLNGEHLPAWNENWKAVTFEGVAAWEEATVPQIVKGLLLDWCRGDTPSEAVRNFVLKMYIVRNYQVATSPPGQAVGSTEFLSTFLSDMCVTGSPSLPLPSAFASWVVKGTTYAHCKAAFADLGIKQVRKAGGQFFANLVRGSALTKLVFFPGRDPLFEGYVNENIGSAIECETLPTVENPVSLFKTLTMNSQAGVTRSIKEIYEEEGKTILADGSPPKKSTEAVVGEWTPSTETHIHLVL